MSYLCLLVVFYEYHRATGHLADKGFLFWRNSILGYTNVNF